MTTRGLAGIACSLLVMACGSSGGGGVSNGSDAGDVADVGGSDTCVNLGNATWVGSEDVTTTSGTCPSYKALSVTFTIKQAAGSCSFDLTNSRVAGITFSGTVSGNSVTWTHAPYAYGGGTLTLNSATGTLSTDLTTLSGDFKWTLAQTSSACTGTTTFKVVKK
jgi:hypothetical protein